MDFPAYSFKTELHRSVGGRADRSLYSDSIWLDADNVELEDAEWGMAMSLDQLRALIDFLRQTEQQMVEDQRIQRFWTGTG